MHLCPWSLELQWALQGTILFCEQHTKMQISISLISQWTCNYYSQKKTQTWMRYVLFFKMSLILIVYAKKLSQKTQAVLEKNKRHISLLERIYTECCHIKQHYALSVSLTRWTHLFVGWWRAKWTGQWNRS